MRDCFFLTCGRLGPAPGRLTNTVAVAVRDGGDVVLVDAGWSAEACADPARAIGRLRMLSLGVRVRASDAIVEQLRALGIEPSRVKTIVATHLHLDHVGGLADFPDAEVVLSEDELRAFRTTTGKLGYRARDLARTARIRTLQTAPAPAWGFQASADVFGGGEVVLLDARGHTAGSVAVALRGPRGAFVHAGDAVYERWEYGLRHAARAVLGREAELVAARGARADVRLPARVRGGSGPTDDRPVALRRLVRGRAARAGGGRGRGLAEAGRLDAVVRSLGRRARGGRHAPRRRRRCRVRERRARRRRDGG